MTKAIVRANLATILVSLAAAIPAMAQTNTSTDVSRFPITPPAPEILAAIEACVGEAVQFHGAIQMVAHETDNPNGGLDVTMIFSTKSVFAVGETTGADYLSPGQFQTHLNVSGPPPLEFSNLFNLGFIGPGQEPNFSLKERFHITIDANGDISSTVDTVSTTCK
jgi:hypothetical protein